MFCGSRGSQWPLEDNGDNCSSIYILKRATGTNGMCSVCRTSFQGVQSRPEIDTVTGVLSCAIYTFVLMDPINGNGDPSLSRARRVYKSTRYG